MDYEITGRQERDDGRLRITVRVCGACKQQLVEEGLSSLAADHGIDPAAPKLQMLVEQALGAPGAEAGVLAHIALRVGAQVVNDEGLHIMFDPEPAVARVPGLLVKNAVKVPIDFFVKPRCTLSSYGPVQASLEIEPVAEADVDAEIDRMLEPYARYENAMGVAEEGDQILVSMQTKVNGEVDEGLSGERLTVLLQRGPMPDAFVANVAGMTIGERRPFSFDDADPASPAGAMAHFEVELYLLARRKRILPALDDTFVAGHFGPTARTVRDLRRAVCARLESERYEKAREQLAKQVDEQLAERLNEPLPDVLLERARDALMANLRAGLEQEGESVEEYAARLGMDAKRLQLVAGMQARDSLRQGLALDALYRHLGLETQQQDLDRALAEMAPGNEEQARRSLEGAGTWFVVEEMASRYAAHRWLMDQAR